ncbi:MAG: PHP domain-containing protein, partial [Planctomycetota bacterium]
MSFIHLHVHSNYSLLQGAFSVEELVREAARRGERFVALTDTNGLYGAVEFYEAARERGVTPIIGSELVYRGEQCVCLAANREGYSNLCRLVTERQLAGTAHAARYGERRGVEENYDLAESILSHSSGLFLLTGTASLLSELAPRVDSGRLFAEWRADESRSFEVDSPEIASSASEMETRGGKSSSRRDTMSGESICLVANRLDVPRVATVNVNFLTSDTRATHGVLSAIRENIDFHGIMDDECLLAGRKSYFMDEREILSRLGGDAEAERAMENSVRIAEACDLDLGLGEAHFPRYDAVPAGETPASYLRSVAERGACERYEDAR